MPRKRKTAAQSDSKSNVDRDEVKKYLFKIQTDEAYHKKYAKELRQLYDRMEHDDFTAIFIHCLKHLMQAEFNQFTNTGLKFMAEFVSSFQAEDMHPLFDTIFVWIFKTVSLTVSVRLRLCEFVNQMLNSLPDDGDIEEFHCTEILSYMIDRLKDISPHVRVQAIKALCRLQNKDDPNDEVIQIFQFHLECDPSPLVRQAVISSIARSGRTIPFILERLQDVDVRVRRTVFAHMSNYSVNKCTVDQRLMLIEQGLSDCSETVRMVAVEVMLPQWLTVSGNNFIAFLTSLKLYRNELEMCRFRNVAQMALMAMFRSHDPCNLIKQLPLIETNDEANSRYNHCIELDELTPEISVYWVTLIDFFQSDSIYFDHLERILPDLPTICDNIARFSTHSKLSPDKLSSQCILLTLIEMLQRLDLSEETGRESVKSIIVFLLVQSTCDESLTKSLITICKKLIPSSNSRLQFYVEIVQHILHPIDLDGSLSACKLDVATESEVSSQAAKLVQLRETKREWLEAKQCEQLTVLEEEICLVKKKLLFLLTPFLPDAAIRLNNERITSKNLLRGLKFIFHGVCSETFTHLNPSMYQLYEDIISVRLQSDNLEVRDWALKCTATFSLLCRKIANCAYHVFCKQLFCHQIKSIWITCIRAIFQLIARYGFDFLDHNQMHDNKPAVSVNDSLLNLTAMDVSATDILSLFNRYMDSSQDVDITCELVDGFCMLIVRGSFFKTEIMAKLIVMFFNTEIEPIITQILSVFFETLIQLKRQKYFQLSVREILNAIATDETFTEDNLRSVLKFLSQAMMSETIDSSTNKVECSRLHNDLAATLLAWMDDQPTNGKSLNIISKEISSLRPLFTDEESKWNLIELVDNLLDQKLPKESAKNLKLFRCTITQSNCTETLLEFSSTRPADGVEENDEISMTNASGEGIGSNNDIEESIDPPIVPVSEKRRRHSKVMLGVKS